MQSHMHATAHGVFPLQTKVFEYAFLWLPTKKAMLEQGHGSEPCLVVIHPRNSQKTHVLYS